MWVTVQDAAERLQCHTKTIMRRIKDKSLTAYQFSHNNIKIDEADLQEYIDRHRTTGQGA